MLFSLLRLEDKILMYSTLHLVYKMTLRLTLSPFEINLNQKFSFSRDKTIRTTAKPGVVTIFRCKIIETAKLVIS